MTYTYRLTPTITEAIHHSLRWQAAKDREVPGLPEWPVERQSPEIGDWTPYKVTARGFGTYSNPNRQRHNLRLVVWPEPEVVAVKDANTAHGLIGRSILGTPITRVMLGPGWCCPKGSDGYLTREIHFDNPVPVSLDPLPAPPPEEEVETVSKSAKTVMVELPLTEAAWWGSTAGLTAEHHVVIRDACLAALAAEGGES